MDLVSSGNTVTDCAVGVETNGSYSALAVSFDGDAITTCTKGISAVGCDLQMYSSTLTGNTVGLEVTGLTSSLLGGSLAAANDIYGNTDQNAVVTGVTLDAPYNHWGTVDEAELLATTTGGVDYSPWTDVTHTQTYTTTYQRGIISGDVHWSGMVNVAGDILIPSGSRLTVDPGTTVNMLANASQWDTLEVTNGLCDIIVEGVLRLEGGASPADSVWVRPWSPEQEIIPGPGMWGGFAFREQSVDSLCVIEGSRLEGATFAVIAEDAVATVRRSWIGEANGYYAVTASGTDSTSGFRIEDSEVAGLIKAQDCGLVELIGNDLPGGVQISRSTYSSPLYTAIVDIRRNTTSRIYLSSAAGGSTTPSLMTVVIDSNSVTGSGTGNGIELRAGKCSYPSRYGNIDATLTRNQVSGFGIGVRGISDQCGVMDLVSSGNTVTDCVVGVETNGPYSTLNASFDGETISECTEGINVIGGSVFFENGLFTDLVGESSLAMEVSGAVIFHFQNNTISGAGNGLILTNSMVSDISLNQFTGRQDGIGILCVGSTPLIENNYIDFFPTGIRCEGDATPTIRNNSLSCATTWGVENTSIGVIVDAALNWWGDPTGPYHTTGNSSGLGSSVSDGVDYSAWLLDYLSRPPETFSLLSPEISAVVDTLPLLDWENAFDPDCHDRLLYTLMIDDTDNFANPTVIQDLVDSECMFPETLFLGGKEYFWKVSASDGINVVWCDSGIWNFSIDSAVAVEEEAPGIPDRWALVGATPNPFNPSTIVHFDVPRDAFVTVDVFDVAGRKIQTLLSEWVVAGNHRVQWNGKNSRGQQVASGVYFCRLKAPEYTATAKMMLIK